MKTLQFSLDDEDAAQFSNERLTTLPGSHPVCLRARRESEALAGTAVAAILRDARLWRALRMRNWFAARSQTLMVRNAA
nr:hypothetical protein CIT39_27240 [Bradyrhizobium symbiodeficiens]